MNDALGSRGDVTSAEGFRIRRPELLLIGAAGRKSGKTLLATQIISRCATAGPVFGVKVTTVHDDERGCPRGGEGCGVCSSFEGAYSLKEETGEAEGKDTTRLLEAGASPVRWLCVREGRLVEGARALLDAFGDGIPIVGESNSLRNVVVPGLFIVVRHEGRRQIKRSCRRVWHLADAVVNFDGKTLDLDTSMLQFKNGRWALRRNAAAIVLADAAEDGRARHGALEVVDGKTRIERVVDQLRPHFSKLLVCAGDPERYQFLGTPIVPTYRPAAGILEGVAASISRTGHELNLVISSSVDPVPMDLLSRLLREVRSGADIVLPVSSAWGPAPWFAVYHARARTVIEEVLAEGKTDIEDVLPRCETSRLALSPDEDSLLGGFTSANRPGMV